MPLVAIHHCVKPMTAPTISSIGIERKKPFQPALTKATRAPLKKPANPRTSAASCAKTSPDSPVTAVKATNEVPSEPKVTAQPCPSAAIMTDCVAV